MASDELTRIRSNAFLRVLYRAAQNQPGTITYPFLAQELGLHDPQLRSLVNSLVSDGVIETKGEPGAEYVVFTEKGLSAANELKNTRPQKQQNTRILCIDTEPEVVQRLTESGYAVFNVEMGYRTGKRKFSFPAPHEVDLILCDLKRPACFDSKDWGPGRSNNNFQCKVVPYEQVNNTFFVSHDRRHAQYKVIQESQLGQQIPGTFGPKDVKRAIMDGGIPFLLFLNQEWLSRAGEFPNWFDVQWEFAWTTATKVELAAPLTTLLPELGKQIKLKLAIQQKIANGPKFGRTAFQSRPSVVTIVRNNIGDVFGQVVKMDKGSAWLIPATHQNVEIIELFASRLEHMHQLAPPQPAPPLTEMPNPYEAIRKRIAETTQNQQKNNAMPTTKIELFISHSNGDAAIAAELLGLLRTAIPGLNPDVIRCTSVPGYQLEGGAKTEEQLRTELLGAEVFIGLLSNQSLQSTYVLFELGARWGANKHLIPLMVAGMTAYELRAPLGGLHALSVSIEPQLHDLVRQIAGKLGLPLAKASVYEGHIKKLIQVSEEEGKKRFAASPASAAT